MQGRPTFADVARRSNLQHVQACMASVEAVQWLSGCLLAEVKNCDILNDICNLLRDASFTQLKPKYVEGLRVLLECNSVEVAQQVMANSSQTLLQWFSWICPWFKDKEACRPDRLLWLNIEGVPLYA